MNLNSNRSNDGHDAATTPKTKHVTFKDTVEWASSSSKDKDNSPTKKYTFWMLLMGILAMVVVVWILMMFMSKSNENTKSGNKARSKSSRNGRSKHKNSLESYKDSHGHTIYRRPERSLANAQGSGMNYQVPVLEGMMSDSGSIQPDSGSQFRKRPSRSYSSQHSNGRQSGSSRSGSNLVNPLPSNDIS